MKSYKSSLIARSIMKMVILKNDVKNQFQYLFFFCFVQLMSSMAGELWGGQNIKFSEDKLLINNKKKM